MKNSRRLTIIIAIASAMLITGLYTAYALNIFLGGGKGPNFSFIRKPYIYGTTGVTFTKYTDLNGKTWWSTTDRTIHITIRCLVKGFGDIQSTISDIEFAGKKQGSSSNQSREIGSWGEIAILLPYSQPAIRATESHSWSKASPEEEGTYTWTAGGKTDLTAYKWKWKFSFNELSGEWKPLAGPSEGATQVTGTWKVEHKHVCPKCKVEGDTEKELLKGHGKESCKREGCNEVFRKCETDKVNKHKLISQCPLTNEDGVQCDKGQFWGCEDPKHKCDFGDGSTSPSEDDDSNNGNNGGNQGNNGGNTIGNLCKHANCNYTITAANMSSHQQTTCDTCSEDYWICDSTHVNEHVWMICSRLDCPVLFHRQTPFRVRKCGRNLRTCITINGVRRYHTLIVDPFSQQ